MYLYIIIKHKQKHTIMKIAAKNIEAGMTIKYAGHRLYEGDEYMSAICGSVKKGSPIIKVKNVDVASKEYKHLNGIFVTTECGLLIEFSTRQIVEVI